LNDSFTIVLPEAIQVIPTSPIVTGGYNVSCNGGSDGQISLAIFGGNGNFTASWTGPNGYTSTDLNITGLQAGEYCVSITDDLTCAGEACITITEPVELSATSQTLNP